MKAPLYLDIADVPTGGAAFFVTTSDNKRIRFALWQGGSRGTLLLFPGRTEYIEKYGIVIARLITLGFAVVVIDWRGQGLSTRPDKSTGLGHVDDFAEYQEDIAAVLAHDALANLPSPGILIAHSMGGCIGLRALHEGLGVAGAIFSAPMWGINPPRLSRPFAPYIARLLNKFGYGRRHVPGADAAYYVHSVGFNKNALTSDPLCYARLVTQLGQHPELGLGGPGVAWVDAAFQETDALMSMAPPLLPIETWIGSDETVVSIGAIEGFHKMSASSALHQCTGARHELFFENDTVQHELWAGIEKFLARF